MKIRPGTMLAAAAIPLLTACAASEPRPTQRGFLLADSYMQAVERNARKNGIDVVWINAPSRSRVDAEKSKND